MIAILLLCLAGIAMAQQPVPCTSPPQWEARIFDTDVLRDWAIQGRLSYDATYHRERLIDEVETGTMDDFYDTVSLFDLQVEFAYNFRARNCTRRPITRPWRDFGIRPNATSYGEAYVGSSAVPGAGMLVSLWGGNITTPNDTITYYSSWTYIGCVPVHRTSFSPRLGVAHLAIYDVTLGISDPSVFIPRRECLTDEEWANRFTLFGTPSKKN